MTVGKGRNQNSLLWQLSPPKAFPFPFRLYFLLLLSHLQRKTSKNTKKPNHKQFSQAWESKQTRKTLWHISIHIYISIYIYMYVCINTQLYNHLHFLHFSLSGLDFLFFLSFFETSSAQRSCFWKKKKKRVELCIGNGALPEV